MNLREMIEKSGYKVGCPPVLSEMNFVNGEHISKYALYNYFSTSNYQNDVLNLMNKIFNFKKEGHKNFNLYFLSNENGEIIYPLKLDVRPVKKPSQ